MTRAIASGATWMVLFKLIDRLLAVVSTIILARLLVPEDFGLVAMAMSVFAVVELATSFGFEIALIQRRHLERQHYDTAWTLNVMIAVGCGLVIVLLAQPAARFYGEERLIPVMLLLAGGALVSGFQNIGIIDFRRQLLFGREFTFMMACRAAGFLITTALAFSLRTYWALVIGALSARVIGLVLSYAMHPFRPRPGLGAARELFGFSGWVLINNLLGVLQARIPHFVVGRVLGAPPLGVLTISTEISQIPSSDLIAPINRAVFPGFSRLADDLDVLRRSFLDVVAMVMLIAIPAAVGIAAVAGPLVRAALGEKWLEAVPVIQVLALAVAAGAATANNGSAYMALGKPRLISVISLVRLLILLPLVIGLTRAFGLIGTAWAELLTAILITSVSLHLLFRQMGLRYVGYFSRIWRPLVAGALMAAGVLAVVRANPYETTTEAVFALLAGVVTGLVLYPVCIVLLWLVAGRPAGAEAILFDRLRGMMARGGQVT